MKVQSSAITLAVVLSAQKGNAQKVDMTYVASLFGTRDITPALLETGTLREGKEKLVPDKKPNSKNLKECDFSVNECDNDGECAAGLLCTDPRKKDFAAMGFGDLFQRRVYCIPQLADKKDEWNWETCYDPKKLESYLAPKPAPVAAPLPSPVSGPSAAVGDPHFITYEGTKYSYHGECDLVLAKNPSFDSGLGLAIHVRTELVTTWSLISNAAVRVGDDIFEVVNDETHYFNGIANAPFPLQLSTKYEITKNVVNTRPTYTINMNDGESISIFINKRMMGVRSTNGLGSIGGMTGIVGHDGVIGRDGVTQITEFSTTGTEWQVRNDEPMLFHTIRAPQYPQQCILPVAVIERRQLRSNDALMTMAIGACAEAFADMKEFCIEDVIQTKDPLSANAYLDGVAY